MHFPPAVNSVEATLPFFRKGITGKRGVYPPPPLCSILQAGACKVSCGWGRWSAGWRQRDLTVSLEPSVEAGTSRHEQQTMSTSGKGQGGHSLSLLLFPCFSLPVSVGKELTNLLSIFLRLCLFSNLSPGLLHSRGQALALSPFLHSSKVQTETDTTLQCFMCFESPSHYSNTSQHPQLLHFSQTL